MIYSLSLTWWARLFYGYFRVIPWYGYAALAAGLMLGWACDSHAAWTPLIQASDFTGILTDMGTTVAGIVGMLLIVAGIGFVIRVLTH